MEKTLVFIKPDAVVRRYVGARLLNQLTEHTEVTHYEVIKPSENFLANEHYAEHEERFFYDWLIKYVSSYSLHVLILRGENVVENARSRLGDTVPNEASPGTLRGRYGVYGGLNAAHASDGISSAQREIDLWESVLDTRLESHERRLNDYINQYLDYPQVDSVRYREVTKQYINGVLSTKEVRSAFTSLLSRESDISSSGIEALTDVMIANAELER